MFLHLKPSDLNDAMECNRWKEMMRGNWSDSSSVMLWAENKLYELWARSHNFLTKVVKF